MLDPSNEYVENVCLSLVREYLIKREFPMTLKCLNKETASLIPRIGFYGSRLALGKDLGLEGLMKLNKLSKYPFKSMLEVLIKSFLQDKELLLRSTFPNTSYYYSKNSDLITARQQTQSSGEQKILTSEERRHAMILGSYSNLFSNFLSQVHSKTPQPIKSSYPLPAQFNENGKLETHIQKTNLENLNQIENVISKEQVLGNHSNESKNVIRTTIPTESELKDEIHSNDEVMKNPMEIFCHKLKESRILNSSHSRLSLDQSHQDDSPGDEHDSHDLTFTNSWIPEQSKSGSHLNSLQKSLIFSSGSNTSVGGDLKRRSSSIALSSLKINHGNEGTSHVTLGQTLLESKQNLLAQVCLSPEENEIRQQAQVDTESSLSTILTSSSALQPLPSSSSKSKVNKLHPSPKKSYSYSNSLSSKSTTVSTDPGFKVHEIDSLPSQFGTTSTSKSQIKTKQLEPFFEKSIPIHQKMTQRSILRTIDLGTWRELKGIVLGDRGIMQEGWIGQGFAFNYNIPYGLVQKKGGPCGILAVVQALLLRNLFFGSQYCHLNELPIDDDDDLLTFFTTATINKITSKRLMALVGALVEILWRCGSKRHSQGHEADEEDTNSVSLCLTTGNGIFGAGSEFRIFYDLEEFKNFMETNLHRFDCIGLLYSVVLTRGVERIQEDMDFQNSPLLGQHGYCTQELMNLLTIGSAISNAFDHEFVLDEKVLKGISCQADIGLLSLFEHYNSCTVGSFLKNPKFPLWIVCSESHFSLLFSNDMTLTTTTNTQNEVLSKKPKNFDLYYYDGLGRQDKIIKLSIRFSGAGIKVISNGSQSQSNNNIFSLASDDDLIPPLEKCIRTKWPGVTVDWNETEPIL